jgi:hypothetical protein
MLRELVHFARTAPSVARLQRHMDRAAFLDQVENALDLAGKARWRSALVADLEGEVLEIGAGSGTMSAITAASSRHCHRARLGASHARCRARSARQGANRPASGRRGGAAVPRRRLPMLSYASPCSAAWTP